MMTQDEVIALAHQMLPDAWRYDTNDDFATLTFDELTRFAAAIEAKVKADLLAGAGEPVGYGMPDTQLGRNHRMMMVRLDKGQDGCTVPLHTADQLAAAVLREREECAKVCVPMPGFKYSPNYLGGITQCAEAIRARGNT